MNVALVVVRGFVATLGNLTIAALDAWRDPDVRWYWRRTR